jgi:hypothetical protein
MSLSNRQLSSWGFTPMLPGIFRLRDRNSPSPKVRRTFVPSVQDKLEDRKLLSTASVSFGSYNVYVWTKTLSSGDVDILARLRKNGSVVRDNIVVANSTRVEQNPAVSVNSSGRFAVVWEDVLSSSDTDIKLRVFNSSGSALTSAMTVDPSTKKQQDADVDLNSFGRIVVAYTHVFSSSDLDVKAKQYIPTSSTGKTYSSTAYTVAAESSRNEFDPYVIVASNGNWAVSYTRRFNANDLDAKAYVRKTSGSSSTYNVANSTSNEDSTSIVSYEGGSSLRVSYRKNGQRFTKSLTV